MKKNKKSKILTVPEYHMMNEVSLDLGEDCPSTSTHLVTTSLHGGVPSPREVLRTLLGRGLLCYSVVSFLSMHYIFSKNSTKNFY